jgi:tRNA (guanine37-N1)-methyltransferase
MWFGVVTILPEIIRAATAGGVFARALAQDVIALDVFNPRDHASDRHQTVDDRPYGGGPGMVMLVEPLLAAIDTARDRARTLGIQAPVVHLSPEGKRLNQQLVNELAELEGLVLICGRYEGIDERVVAARADRVISIGDYVLSGGELPALIVMDAIARHRPGTLGNAASVVEESHLDGLLDYPHYTRPEVAGSGAVPAILLSGDHGAIRRWRLKEALRRTWQLRPDLLTGRGLSDLERELLAEIFDEDGLDTTTGRNQ